MQEIATHPVGLELDAGEAILRKDSERSSLEPVRRRRDSAEVPIPKVLAR